MEMSRFMKLFFALFAVLFIGGIIFNIIIFKDCMDRGNAMYQCNAAMSNPNYIAVDQMGREDF